MNFQKLTTGAMVAMITVAATGQGAMAADFGEIKYHEASNVQELCQMLEGAEVKTDTCGTNATDEDLRDIKIKLGNRTLDGKEVYDLLDKVIEKKFSKKGFTGEDLVKKKLDMFKNLTSKLAKVYKTDKVQKSTKYQKIYGGLYFITNYGVEAANAKLVDNYKKSYVSYSGYKDSIKIEEKKVDASNVDIKKDKVVEEIKTKTKTEIKDTSKEKIKNTTSNQTSYGNSNSNSNVSSNIYNDGVAFYGSKGAILGHGNFSNAEIKEYRDRVYNSKTAYEKQKDSAFFLANGDRNDYYDIDLVKWNLESVYNSLKNGKTEGTSEIYGELVKDYNKYLSIYTNGGLTDSSFEGTDFMTTIHNHYNSNYDTDLKKVLGKLGYRYENGKLTYYDNLNILKTEFSQYKSL